MRYRLFGDSTQVGFSSIIAKARMIQTKSRKRRHEEKLSEPWYSIHSEVEVLYDETIKRNGFSFDFR